MTQETYSIEWKTKPLGSVCRFAGGYGFPDKYQGALDGDILFIKVSDMSLPRNERYIVTANNYVSSHLARSLGWKPFPSGSIVFAKVGAALKLNKRRILTQPTLIDNNMMAAIPSSELDGGFLFHFLTSIDFADFAQEGALPSVNQKQIESIALPDISETEQSRIAEVLNAADAAIQRTNTLINKLKWMKAGLLGDLLTRGLDRDGKLRDPILHPEQFKDSPLGLIPKEWEVEPLKQALDFIDAGKSPTCLSRAAAAGEWGVLKVSAIRPEGFRPHENKAVINPLHINEAYEVKDGDLLISRANTYELVGLTCLVRNPPSQLMLCDKTLRLNVNKVRALSEFLFHVTQTPFVRSQIEIDATGSSGSMKNISQETIENLCIPLPELNEQEMIAGVLNIHDSHVRAEEANRAKLIQIKRGLMHDLLTGRVRVPATKSEVVAV